MVTAVAKPESIYVSLAQGRMHCLRQGEGDPLICLHGNPTGSFFFSPLFDTLANQFQLVAPDHLGCGASDRPPATTYGYRLADRVADIEQLLDILQLHTRLTLVLHDWGGMIGLLFAARHPDRVERLILMNTAGFGLPEGKALPLSLRLCRVPLLGDFLVRGLNLFCLGASMRCLAKRRWQPQRRQLYLAPYSSWKRRLAVHRFVQDIPAEPSHPSWPLLQEVENCLDRMRNIPRLICWGGRDFVFDAAFRKEWQRRWPDAEFADFPEAGHYLLEDEPQAVPERIAQFLHRHPLAS